MLVCLLSWDYVSWIRKLFEKAITKYIYFVCAYDNCSNQEKLSLLACGITEEMDMV